MFDVKSGEVSKMLLQQLTGFEKKVDIYDVGTVLSVGDGVARVFGLSKCMATELL
ncbi:MAG: F0F1 ATP synthase subunit alpha, partial [Ignavibacteriae bacterium]|nr:F0F1 ATP synthase subunit alpha [Ignavibacteriota bacterium]